MLFNYLLQRSFYCAVQFKFRLPALYKFTNCLYALFEHNFYFKRQYASYILLPSSNLRYHLTKLARINLRYLIRSVICHCPKLKGSLPCFTELLKYQIRRESSFKRVKTPLSHQRRKVDEKTVHKKSNFMALLIYQELFGLTCLRFLVCTYLITCLLSRTAC